MHARCSGVKPFSFATAAFAPGADQQIGDGEIVDMRGPVERGRAIALRRIDIDALLDERAHRRDVLTAYGLDEAHVGAGGNECRLRDRATINSDRVDRS